MTMCADEAVTRTDETYWVDDNAAQPVLLLDEATEAITEALHRVRSGSVLHHRDLAAAGVALGDLFGGLGQLADLLTISVGKYTETGPLHAARLEDRLETLRAMTLSAQQAAEGLRLETAATRPTSGHATIPLPA
ncbi:MAG: hypothetical protein ACRDRP_24900 [Pseudonocardiaceae bacterium]